MNLLGQIRVAAAVAVVLGSLFGLGDLARVIWRNAEYVWDPAMIAIWLVKAVAVGAAFALVLAVPAAILYLAIRRGERSPERVRRVTAGAWILIHVFLVLLWQDYRDLEQEISAGRMAAKAGFLAAGGLAAWGLSGVAAWIAVTVPRLLRPRVVVVLLGVLVAAFFGAKWREDQVVGPLQQAEGPNVLFILVDTLRADSLGCYGYERDTSPRIDTLAGEGMLFREVVGQSSWTIPTVASNFTGVYPEVHNVTNYEATLSEEFVTLAEAFQAAGYRTGARISNILVSRSHGYHQGFEDARVMMDLYQLLFLEELLAQARITRHYYFATANEITDAGLAWLRRHGKERFFLYLHYYDPHYPYYPPPDYAMRYVEPEMAERFPYYRRVGDSLWNMVAEYKLGDRTNPEEVAYVKAVYDAEMNFADDQIARVLDYLEEAGLADDTIVVFTSDHGEQFYEHGQKLHSKTLYNEEILVPLIIKAPGYEPGETDVRVRALDIYQTLISLAGLPERLPDAKMAEKIAAQAMGASLIPLMRREPLPADANRIAYSSLDMDGVVKKVYFEEAWKLIQNIEQGDDIERPPVELYRTTEDPGEQNDLASGERATVGRLANLEGIGRAAMARLAPAASEKKPLSKSEVEKLKALGYINQ